MSMKPLRGMVRSFAMVEMRTDCMRSRGAPEAGRETTVVLVPASAASLLPLH